MINYLWLTVLTIVGALCLCATLLFAKDAIRALKGDGPSEVGPIFIIYALISCACLYPGALFIINSPATVDDISNLTRTCSSAKELIESKTELVRHREVITIYNQCLKEQELAEEVTLEKQKKAAVKK